MGVGWVVAQGLYAGWMMMIGDGGCVGGEGGSFPPITP